MHFVTTEETALNTLKHSEYQIVCTRVYGDAEERSANFLDSVAQESGDTIRLVFGSTEDKSTLLAMVYRGDAYSYFLTDHEQEDIRMRMMQASCEYDNYLEINALKRQLIFTRADWESRYAELELIANHEMDELAVFKQIMDTLPIPIIATSRDGRMIYANKEVYAAFPSLASLTSGKAIAKYLPPVAMEQYEYCIENDLHVAADPFDLDGSSVHLRVFPVTDRRADLVVLMLQEIYATTG